MKFKSAFILFAPISMALLIIGCADPSHGRRTNKVQAITHQDFLEAEKRDPYFKGRWAYFSIVVDLVQKIQPESVLELGPWRLPLVKGEDTMDIEKVLENLTYLHDATKTPWPIADNKYDLFIGCEVFEHLGNKQKEAFKEVMRISRRAILTFPYRWVYAKDAKDETRKSHENIDGAKIAEWTFHIKPKKTILTAVGRNKFIVYYFEFRR